MNVNAAKHTHFTVTHTSAEQQNCLLTPGVPSPVPGDLPSCNIQLQLSLNTPDPAS